MTKLEIRIRNEFRLFLSSISLGFVGLFSAPLCELRGQFIVSISLLKQIGG